MKEYKNKTLRILGFGSMDYNTIKDRINRTLYTYTNEDTTPSEKRILGQMLLTIADHEQNEQRKEWEEEETKEEEEETTALNGMFGNVLGELDNLIQEVK